MHEFSLCRYILEIVQTRFDRQGYSSIKNIYLELGELVAVEKEALLFAFDILKKKTAVENASLCIIPIAGAAWCASCHKSKKIRRRFSACETCGEMLLTIIRGDELRIKSMEVE
jgi:hydrogenase nickel incorporation protein HypA/HybF